MYNKVKKNNVVAIIQCRSNSTRFPFKWKSKLAGKPCLQHIVDRLQSVPTIDCIVVATTTHTNDLQIVEFCKSKHILCYRGSEDDVLSRVSEAAYAMNPDDDALIVDITADCPLIDPAHIKHLIDIMQNGRTIGNDIIHDMYASNVVFRTFPDGYDVQVYKHWLLKKVNELVSNPVHRCHAGWNVIEYIRNNDTDIHCFNLHAPEWYHYPHWGLTLDTPEDLTLLKKIFGALYKKNNLFGIDDVMHFLLQNTYLLEINKNVERKIPGDG